jgi:hypothetical protein
MRSSLFFDVTQHRFVVSNGRFGKKTISPTSDCLTLEDVYDRSSPNVGNYKLRYITTHRREDLKIGACFETQGSSDSFKLKTDFMQT